MNDSTQFHAIDLELATPIINANLGAALNCGGSAWISTPVDVENDDDRRQLR